MVTYIPRGLRSRRRLRRGWIGWTIAILVAVFALCAALIVWSGLHDRIGPADLGVVLGAKVERGGVASTRLAARLDEAAGLYRQGAFPLVMVSGGPGKEGFDEASVMQAYLVAHGVPATAIVVDSKGVNTRATAINAVALMHARGITRVVAISQYFHIPRIRLAFKQAGAPVIYNAHARLFDWRDPFSIAREVVGYPVYLAGGR